MTSVSRHDFIWSWFFFIPLLDLVSLLDFSLPFGLKTLFLNLVSSWLFSLHDFWSLFMTFGLSSWLRSFFMTFGLSSWHRSFFTTFGLSAWLRSFFMTFGPSSWLLVFLHDRSFFMTFGSAGLFSCFFCFFLLWSFGLSSCPRVPLVWLESRSFYIENCQKIESF